MKPSSCLVRLFSTLLLVTPFSCLLSHANGQGTNFGPVNVGAVSTMLPVTLTFGSSTTIGSTAVLTQGSPGLDFSDAGSGTCTVGTAYSPGQTCTMNVGFRPRFSGARAGAAVLYDSAGNVLATAYVQGIGVGPQVGFLPASESLISGASVSNPHGIAVDGNGNLYVSDDNGVEKETYSNGSYSQSTIAGGLSGTNLLAIDGAGNLYITEIWKDVLKETPVAGGYQQSVVDSGFGYPYGVAVDGAGDVFIADALNGNILKETPSAGGYTRSVVVSGLSNPVAVAVDGAGNLYIAEDGSNGSGTLLKESLSAGGYTETALPIEGSVEPYAITVDGVGNVYFTDSQTYNVYKETPTPSGYVESTLITDLHDILGPYGLAVDGNGAIYIAYLGGNSVVKSSFENSPSLTFASTPVGTTSADSPQTVSLTNIGNADLTFPIPVSGNDPSIATNFTLDQNAPSACPVVGSGSSQPGTLSAGASCVLPVSFTPTSAGNLSGSLALTDDNLNAAAPTYDVQSISLSGAATQATPTLTWSAPASITYGTALSGTQLDATASVSGTFSYSPASGAVLSAGTQTLRVTFTPADSTDYTAASATVQLTVNKATPDITWPTPAPIVYGTALSSAQLDATGNVPGTFAYSPAAGTILPTGTQTLNVVFTPTDSADYVTATDAVTLLVNPPPSYTLAASPSSLSIRQGSKASGTISVNPVNGFSGSVTISISGVPKGVTATISPNPTTTTSTITFTVSNGASLGTTSVAVTGKSGSIVQTATITLTVAHK